MEGGGGAARLCPMSGGHIIGRTDVLVWVRVYIIHVSRTANVRTHVTV